jgi:hypothetical protein
MIGNGRTQHTVHIYHNTITKEHPQTHTEPSDGGKRGEGADTGKSVNYGAGNFSYALRIFVGRENMCVLTVD